MTGPAEAGPWTEPAYLGPAAMPVFPAPWPTQRDLQTALARAYLDDRPDTEAVTRRAAVILLAGPDAPEFERVHGVRATVHRGQEVTCRNPACRRRWLCLPEDPWFDVTGEGGLCLGCVLAETRRDIAVPVIEPAKVTKRPPRKPRKPPRARPGPAGDGDTQPPVPAAEPAPEHANLPPQQEATGSNEPAAGRDTGRGRVQR